MGLCICTEAYKTFPVDSLYVDLGMAPLFIRREELGLWYLSRVLTSHHNPNYKFVKNPVDRAINKPKLPKPLEVRLQVSSREVGLLPPQIVEIQPPKFPPWCRPPVDICNIQYDKSCSIQQLQAEFSEHQNQHTTQISIYTDGSKSVEGVGFAVVSGNSVIKKRLPSSSSIFTAELHAVFNSLKYIFNQGSAGERYVIYTDSQSVLTSLKKLTPSHHLVQEVQDWLVLLHSRRRIRVSFCWVPAHVGIDGNEQADAAAKEAARFGRSQCINVPHTDYRGIIRSYTRSKWQEHWNALTTNQKLKAIRQSVNPWQSSCHPCRRTSIILTRLRIGHTRLTHRHLMGSGEERQAPQCNSCQTELTVKHILVDCAHFNSERRLNSLDGRSIQEILNDEANVESIANFLKQINLYYDM